MHILWLDPFHAGSHAAVAGGYARHSQHAVTVLPLSFAGGWRWRMRGAAITFARMLRARPELCTADLIVATDMLDLATFLGLARDLVSQTPVALYLHENQLTYPLPPGRKLDLAFPWINYTSALAADALFFNSDFHRRVFLEALPGLPGRFHDYHELELVDRIHVRAHVLHPGLDLAPFDTDQQQPQSDVLPGQHAAPTGAPVILWNSRWEYDKNPEAFFSALRELERRGMDFQLIVAGEHIDTNAPTFAAAREWAAPRCLWWGYAPDAAAYRRLLRRADIVVSTAIQEFFGIAVLEAIYAGCIPVLPRRLSYPELIPPDLQPLCLYDDDTELADRLATTLQNLPELRQRDFRQVAARFRWPDQAPRYDDAFAAIRKQ